MTQSELVDVRRVSTHLVDVPSIRPHRFAGHEIKHQSYVVVAVESADGAVGVGEGVSPGGPWWGGESVEGQRAMIDHYFAPVLVDAGPLAPGTAMERLDAVAHGNPFAKAAVEMALFDMIGRRLGVPVSALLGGGRCRDRIPVRWALGAADVDAVSVEAAERLADGHAGLKLKMGALPVEDDVARVAAIVDRVGSGPDYLVDPNGVWDLPTARWAIDELEAVGVATVEQPVDRADLDGMAGLVQRAGVISIMADESVCTPADALAVARRRVCDAVAVKVGKAGGLRAAWAVASIVSAAGLACYGGTALESSIGTAASAHLFAALPRLDGGSELVGPLLLADDLAVDPLTYRDGALVVPTGPGLGVEVDWDRVREHERR